MNYEYSVYVKIDKFILQRHRIEAEKSGKTPNVIIY